MSSKFVTHAASAPLIAGTTYDVVQKVFTVDEFTCKDILLGNLRQKDGVLANFTTPLVIDDIDGSVLAKGCRGIADLTLVA